jgi:hypothetical protein
MQICGDKPIYLSLSSYLYIYLIYGSTFLCWTMEAFFSFLIYTQSVGPLGRMSARHEASSYTQDNTNTE